MPVTVTCRVLKLHRQHYYRWLACPVGVRELAGAWVANADWWDARCDAILAVKEAFDRNNITIPYPHQVHVDKPHIDRRPPQLQKADDEYRAPRGLEPTD